MLRRALILLACWSLLLPPGLCLCQASAPRAAAAKTPKCRCCRPAEPPAEHAPACPASPQWQEGRVAVPPLGVDLAPPPALALFAGPVAAAPFCPPPPAVPAAHASLYSCNFRC